MFISPPTAEQGLIWGGLNLQGLNSTLFICHSCQKKDPSHIHCNSVIQNGTLFRDTYIIIMLTISHFYNHGFSNRLKYLFLQFFLLA